ncbi:MAG: DUF6587 family protein [Asticcacaulis sp.]
MYAVFQTAVIALILLISLAQLFRTLWPKTARAVAGRFALGLRREAMPPPLRHIGVWLTPKDVEAEGCASGGCTACKGCATFTFDPAAEPAPPVRR